MYGVLTCPVQALKRHGEMTASQLACLLDISIESVYEQLVAAEAKGLVRVNIHHHYDTRRAAWEAL